MTSKLKEDARFNTRSVFNVETCRTLFIQSSIILSLFVAISFDIETGATNKSMNGKHWTLI